MSVVVGEAGAALARAPPGSGAATLPRGLTGILLFKYLGPEMLLGVGDTTFGLIVRIHSETSSEW